MPAHLTMHIEADDPLASLIAATVSEVCAAATPPVDLAIVAIAAPVVSAPPVVLPSLAVTEDPSRRVVGPLLSREEAARAVERLTGSEPPRQSGPVIGDVDLITAAATDDCPLLALDDTGHVMFATEDAATLLGTRLDDLVGTSFGIPATDDTAVTLHGAAGIRRDFSVRCLAGLLQGRPVTLAILREETETVLLRRRLAEMRLVEPVTGLLTERALCSAAAEIIDGGRPVTLLSFDVVPDRDLLPPSVDRLMVALGRELDDATGDMTLLARVGPCRIAALLAPDEDERYLGLAAMRCLDQHHARVVVGSATSTTGIEEALARAFAAGSQTAPTLPR